MSITIQPFGFMALTEAVNQMLPVPSFIKDLLFGRVETNATKTVLVDIIVGGQKIAPFVRRGDPAKVLGNLGVKTNTVEPPEIRLKKLLKPDDLYYTRGAGAPLFVPGGPAGNDPLQQARLQRIAREQKDMKDIIDRTIEFLCAKGLAGSYSITQDNLAFSIDFSMPAANKPVLANTALWSAPTTCNPIQDMDTWKVVAQQGSGRVPTVAIMSPATWALFFASAKVIQYLNAFKINIGQIQTDPKQISAGAERKATINNVDYYTYAGIYVDSNGAQQQLIPDGYVALVSPSADYRLQFAGVDDLEAGTVVGQYFSKDWIEKDPSGLWLLVESHPLPTFNQPAANIYAKVIA
jgi:hypothetical protein